MPSLYLKQHLPSTRHQCSVQLCRCPKQGLLKVLLESLQQQTDKTINGFQHEPSSLNGIKKGMIKAELNEKVHAAPTNGHVGLSNGYSRPDNGRVELTNGHADHESGPKPPHLSHQVCPDNHDRDFS